MREKRSNRFDRSSGQNTMGIKCVTFEESQRQILDAIREVFQCSGLGENLQIVDGPPNGDPELVGVNDASELLATPLTLRCLRQQVIVLAEEHTAKLAGSVQQTGIFQLRRAIQLRRQNIHTPQQEPARDCCRHMHVQVEADAHASLPISRKRFRTGDSPACARSLSTFPTLR